MVDGEQITHWLKILEVVLISSVKFLFAPFEAERYAFNFGQSFAITTSGGLIGILVFYYAGTKIAVWWKHVKAIIMSVFLRRPAAVLERRPVPIFTRRRRRIVRIKMNFGLAGIAFVTPCLISIPIGTVIAAHFFRRRKPVLLYLTTSLILWSLVLNGIAQILKLSQYIPHVK